MIDQNTTFLGYRRENGRVGVRNHVIVLPGLLGALFAYQDAVYLDPSSVAARVRLGRASLSLRYPAQAQATATRSGRGATTPIDPAIRSIIAAVTRLHREKALTVDGGYSASVRAAKTRSSSAISASTRRRPMP